MSAPHHEKNCQKEQTHMIRDQFPPHFCKAFKRRFKTDTLNCSSSRRDAFAILEFSSQTVIYLICHTRRRIRSEVFRIHIVPSEHKYLSFDWFVPRQHCVLDLHGSEVRSAIIRNQNTRIVKFVGSLQIVLFIPMAEILEEFDQPSPLPVVFCQKIPLEEYDQHSAKTTRAALQELMNHLDSNPDEYYKIVRRKKADNLKLLQFMKVKVMNKLQDGYLEKYFPPEQCQEDLENLKHEMASAYDYAQGSSIIAHESQ